ncbi:MAG: hypothetical protein J3K34DRAFT_145965 [Monoraphidium minutum]|nr:MAG: hypothetical protein J3K34DRAFT_145965 [Monoraphidium minutum]
MSESALGKQSKAWLQQAVAARGGYDPSVHTTKAALVAALVAGGAAAADAPPAGTAVPAVAAAGEAMLIGEEEVGLDEAPQSIVPIGLSYEEVLSQVSAGAGPEDEPSIAAAAAAAAGRLAEAEAAAEAEVALAAAVEIPEAGEFMAAVVTDITPVPHLPAGGDAAAAPGLDDIAAALAEARADAPGDLSAVEDEAEDAALSAFDHAALDLGGAADAWEAAPDAGEAAFGFAAAAAAAAPASVFEEGAALVDEAPDAALGAFDHMAFDPDLQRASADQFARADPHGVFAAAAAHAEASPLVVQDEAPDAALGAFDHAAVLDAPAAAAAAPPAAAPAAAPASVFDESVALVDEAPDAALGAFDHAAALDAPAPAPVAAPAAATVAAAAGAPLQLEQEQQQRAEQQAADFVAQLRAWVGQVAAMFEEWQRSLNTRACGEGP